MGDSERCARREVELSLGELSLLHGLRRSSRGHIELISGEAAIDELREEPSAACVVPPDCSEEACDSGVDEGVSIGDDLLHEVVTSSLALLESELAIE